MLNELPNLDPTALERLHRLGGKPFVVKMLALFLDYSDGKIAEARAAYTRSDLEAVQKAVHPLKSSAGNVGVPRVQEWASRVELLAKQGDPLSVAAGLNELERAFAEVKPELEQRKQQAETPEP
jgi:HPt (histidine-containing phosphotransfer) domain-containing protein